MIFQLMLPACISRWNIIQLRWLHNARINFLLFSVISFGKEKRKMLLSRTRGRKCHVLKFYFVVLDGVDRRYVNAKRSRQKKDTVAEERGRWIGKSRRTTGDVCFMEDTIEQASGLANPTENILLRAYSFHLFTKIKYRSFFEGTYDSSESCVGKSPRELKYTEN